MVALHLRSQDTIQETSKLVVYLLWTCTKRSKPMWMPWNGLNITKLPHDPLWEVPDPDRSTSDPAGVQAGRLKRTYMSVVFITRSVH
ncbi:hypothetical protein A2U01_0055708, partial [Trifolium medium]|nr:hypothetical protein [Trifolium medium]